MNDVSPKFHLAWGHLLASSLETLTLNLVKQNKMNILGHINTLGLGARNERGQRLLQFCFDHNVSIANTLFAQLPRRDGCILGPHQMDDIATKLITF